MPNVQSYRAIVTTQVFLAVLMLLAGSGIYLLFRSKTLYIYKWCAVLGFSESLSNLRCAVSGWNVSEFVKFNLPDGLYCAAYILIMDAIWYKESGWMKYFIVFLVPFVTISSEALQYFGVVRGTFDYSDLVCYAIPPLTYFFILIELYSLKQKKK